MTTYKGKSVFPGVAFGVIRLMPDSIAAPRQEAAGSADEEWQRFLAAKADTDSQLGALFEKTVRELGEEQAMIIDVQRMMLEDGDFIEAIEDMIRGERLCASEAVIQAGRKFSDFFASLDDAYMRARATDIIDVSQRIADSLTGRSRALVLSEPSVIVAGDLTPSETLQLDRELVAAIVIRQGAANSHTSILARTMCIPCLIRADVPDDETLESREIIVDAGQGLCYIDPDETTRLEMEQRAARERADARMMESMRDLAAVTASGRVVRLFANIGGVDDVKHALEYGAEGIGVVRSEFLYIGRADYPSEEELFETYRLIVEGMNGKKVIIRTLDIGSDKQAGYFELDDEENPALGLRGVRLCIERKEIFRTQLRAILRASVYGKVAVMFPMITSLWEVRFCREFMADIRKELTGEGIAPADIEIGIMIETPASVMIAGDLAKEVDFFSVGTNDLTQYTLAIDRQNNKLDRFSDTHHPAVMEMLRIVAKSARDNGIWAGICGELAADLEVTGELVGMGYEELSVSPPFLPRLKKRIRELD